MVLNWYYIGIGTVNDKGMMAMTVDIRKTRQMNLKVSSATLDRVDELMNLLSKRLGSQISRVQAVEMAISAMLEKEKQEKKEG